MCQEFPHSNKKGVPCGTPLSCQNMIRISYLKRFGERSSHSATKVEATKIEE